jgi:hypothetical protein
MSAFDIIVIATTVLASVPLLASVIAPKPDVNSKIVTTCKVMAGTGDHAEGDHPNIHIFDRLGATIGIAEGSSEQIFKGQGADIHIQQFDPSKSENALEYMSVISGGNGALCIVMISCTTPTGLFYSWSGDVAQQCDGVGGQVIPWYESNTIVSQQQNRPDVKPKCIWIDGDRTGGMKTMGFGLHLPSFRPNQNREADFSQNKARMCNSKPRFHIYEQIDKLDPIPFFKTPVFDEATFVDFDDKALDESNWDTRPFNLSDVFGGTRSRLARDVESNEDDLVTTDNDHFHEEHGKRQERSGSRITDQASSSNGAATNRVGSKSKQAATSRPVVPINHRPLKLGSDGRRAYPYADKLIRSNSTGHSAKRLCGSRGSWGPDFYSHAENLFCDMDKKRVWPACDRARQTSCFDTATNKMRLGKGNSRRDEESGVAIPRKSYTNVEEW